ncbi:IS66 family insertion sequence element accessory protein TnpB [Cobetia marina]|uniref:IS66 family insertion sequence element accessory protein TnpB n=1 Tax=Cobetia marina TaxID=28258 RepID=UPI003B8A7E65
MACLGGRDLSISDSGTARIIRIDEIWLATQPQDMRAGPVTVLAKVVKVFGTARPHCADLFANRRGNRMKVLIHDGLGVWLYWSSCI